MATVDFKILRINRLGNLEPNHKLVVINNKIICPKKPNGKKTQTIKNTIPIIFNDGFKRCMKEER
jgi:hypothetical protein